TCGLTRAEYAKLVDGGEKVETVASPVLLMVYNWPKASDRYNRLVKLIDALFSKIEQFHDPSRHPKWRDTSLTATARGWQRFPAAEEWLRQHTNTTQVTSTQAASQQAGASQRATEQERLFQKFLEWSKSQGKQGAANRRRAGGESQVGVQVEPSDPRAPHAMLGDGLPACGR